MILTPDGRIKSHLSRADFESSYHNIVFSYSEYLLKYVHSDILLAQLNGEMHPFLRDKLV